MIGISTAVLTLFLTAPTEARSEEAKMLKSAGCKTEYFLLHDLSEAYKQKTGKKLQLGKTGNKKAVSLLMEDRIDFTFTCKTIDQLAAKIDLDKNAVSSWTSIPVAKDPIVIVANKENGITNLTTGQVTDIFLGKIKNWKEVGGNDLPVRTSFMNPKLESGVVLLFREFVGEGKLDENAQVTDGPSMSGNYVSITPGGVTFMGYNSYREKYGMILSIDDVAPTRENILNGKYTLSASYYLTVDDKEREGVSEFIDFALSDEGRKAIEVNFIPYAD
jgi:phosphate transport system substrate-binding protein